MGLQVFKKEITIGLSRTFRIVHISDMHLACKDELCTVKEAKEAEERSENWLRLRKDFARASGEVCGKEHSLPAELQFSELLDYTTKINADALVISGDAFDHYSPANMRFIKEKLNQLTLPYLWVCGNHEGGSKNYEEYAPFMHSDPSLGVLDLKEFFLVGLDNSSREILPEQLEKLEEIFTKGKPVLLVMHVPMMTESNHALLEARCGPYFVLNHEGCSETTAKFCALLQTGKTPVEAILAGHLHFENVSKFADGKYQFVASQGLIGFLNEFTLK